MITTRRFPRTRRLLIGAFVLSLIVHLIGGGLWGHGLQLVDRVMRRLPEQHQREQEVATSDVIHLEKRNVPRPAQRSRAQPLHRPEPRTNLLPQRVVSPIVVRPKPQSLQPRPMPSVTAAEARSEIARITEHAPPHATKRFDAANAVSKAVPAGAAQRAALSAAQLARLNAQFSKTIAATHLDLATIQKRTEERPVATKRYPMQFTGMQAQLQRGEGYISPTTLGQRIGGTIWYYTHYTYMWPDGHIEDDDIPWPFRFPLQRDLFALHVHLIPLQLPPPGFHLSRPLKPFLAHFVQTSGAG